MSDFCKWLHEKCSKMEHFSYSDIKNIPNNGVYVFFEEGEKAYGCRRIVRIGKNDKDGRLKKRIKDHFAGAYGIGASSFRTDLREAFIRKSLGEKAVNEWKTNAKQSARLKNTLDEATEYMRNNLSFVVFAIDDPVIRSELEAKITGEVSSCGACKCSGKWLGLHSGKPAIRESGLWQTDYVLRRLTKKDCDILSKSSKE